MRIGSNGSPDLTPLNNRIDPIPTPGFVRHSSDLDHARLARRCCYVKPRGERCGSPAMRGFDLCYYHDRYQPKPNYRNIPCLEDPHSVQCAIQEIIEEMINGLLDYKKAALALYGMQTAAANLKQMRLADERRENQMNTGRTRGTRRDLGSHSESVDLGYPETEDQEVDSYAAAEDELEETELVDSDQTQESSAPSHPPCVRSSSPATDDQRPTTLLESPRTPQHVRLGLTSAERVRMKEQFPDLKKIRAEVLASLTPEERAAMEARAGRDARQLANVAASSH